MSDIFTHKLAGHLKQLRISRNWSLDDLAIQTGISRATLSRIEKSDVSPNTETLNRLCVAFKLRMSQLLASLEDNFENYISQSEQAIWQDPNMGFKRRSVSPPHCDLMGEIIEGQLDADTHVHYPTPSIMGLEHHVYMLDGELELTLDNEVYELTTGDCLRYKSTGSITFQTSKSSTAHYLIFITEV